MGLLSIGEKQAFLITDAFNRFYFSRFSVSEGIVLLTEKENFYFLDARYYSAYKDKSNSDITFKLFNSLADIEELIKEKNVCELFVDYDKTTLTEYEEYKRFGVSIKDCSCLLKQVRSVKSEEEYGLIRTACEITEKSFYETLPYIKLGVTERELASVLEKKFIDNGADGIAFETIVAFNKNSAVPHHETGDSILTNNSAVLFDFGCKYKGYLSDCTRTVYFGSADKTFKDRYNAVWGANELAEKTILEGYSTDSADAVARDYLKKLDLDKYFTHSLGHGVGLEIHEFPTLSPRRSNILKENTVFTVEPGIYIDGEYGIRIEDTVIIKNGKVKRLFTDSKDLIEIK